jgi:acetyl esterase/lipase
MPLHRVHMLSDALASGRSPALMRSLRTQAMELGLNLCCLPVSAREGKTSAAADAVVLHLQGQFAPVTEIGGCRVAVMVSEPPLDQAARPPVGANTHLIHGRGEKGFKWALRFIAAQLAHRSVKFNYGPERDQSAWLTGPHPASGSGGPRPVAVLAHGGFWGELVALDHMAPPAAALASRGFVVCNLEYRRQLRWHDSCRDILSALGRLPSWVAGFGGDISRVVLLGHSSGAHLLHCALAEGTRQLDRCGIRVRMMVSLAGVLDIAAAAAAGLGDGAIEALIRGSDPGRPLPDPLQQNPDTAMLLVHGAADRTVPPAQSQSYFARRRKEGGTVHLMLVDAVDHMDLIKPELPHWREIEQQMSGAVRQGEGLVA